MQGLLNDQNNVAIPGLMLGDYPERDEHSGRRHRSYERLLQRVRGDFGSRVFNVLEQSLPLRQLSAADFATHREAIRERFAREGFTATAIDFACAYAVEGARRVLDKTPYDCQIFAALAMLDQHLVEMATGEGKSLATALAAAVAALAGTPVHVLTANDYLVVRDAEEFAPLYTLLGLSVAAVTAEQTPDARRLAYRQAIVCVTAREVAFDYLRDRLQHGCGLPALQRRALALADNQIPPPFLRGLCMALVDEADSVLIDEAQMPLILSRGNDNIAQRAFLWQAFSLSGRLLAVEDFIPIPSERRVMLTDAGRQSIERLAARLSPVWKNRQHREETIVMALVARHVFNRDRDYVVADGKIHIIDPISGRIALGRKWGQGLHALVALKEGCKMEADTETLAQITFQRFFRRYLRMGGMSGTLHEARLELAEIYGLPIVEVAPRLPNQRRRLSTRFFADDRQRWQAVVSRVLHTSGEGRPMLIGTDSVADSQELSTWLQQAHVEHVVLNANNDQAEADIIAAAGRAGAVTVSTNMAGRGTDIHPDAAALKAGGLHVLSCQHNPSQRLDRQLAGRAGRQGQPGSSESWISLSSTRFTASAWSRRVAALCRYFVFDGEVRLPSWLLQLFLTVGQHADEVRQARKRRLMLLHDIELERGLTFCDRQK